MDQRVIDQLIQAGSNLENLHEIEFFLYFSDEERAGQAAELVSARGFNVSVSLGVQGDTWLCFATKKMIPDVAILREIRRDLERIAAAFDGEYDGWGTGVVE